tara:strand:- start:1658 stop:2188 length:531 start_codon:yes stop_codon:yes gene_type:complete
MGNFISSNTYDPTHVDTSAKWRPQASAFPYYEADDEEESTEEDFDLDDEIESLGKKWKQQTSGDYYRGDPQSFGRSVLSTVYENMSNRKGISPIANLYKNADGPPIGTGGSGQAFRTTGMPRRTGTLWGFTKGNVKSKKRKPRIKFRLKDFFEDFEEADHDLLENFFLSNQSILTF